MKKTRRARITLASVRALTQPGQVVWDTDIKGFYARRNQASTTYMLFYRAKGRQRWHTIGKHGGPWTPDLARKEALRLLGEVVTGADPHADKYAQRRGLTVAQLVDLYWQDAQAGRLLIRGGRTKKPGTLGSDASRVAHIKAGLGKLAAESVSCADVEKFMFDVAEGRTSTGKQRGGKAAAGRVVALLSAIYNFGRHRGLLTNNPCDITKFRSEPRTRRLSDDEYAIINTAIARALGEGRLWPPALHAFRFLMLTGWRRSEAAQLLWEEIDVSRRTVILGDTKTGRSIRPLPQAACTLLQQQQRIVGENRVFPPAWGQCVSLGNAWTQFRKEVGLSGITLHTLRHSFASVGGDLDFAEATIGALLGHKAGTITGKYIHRSDRSLLLAADEIANHILNLMIGVAEKAAAAD
jgi:integrase